MQRIHELSGGSSKLNVLNQVRLWLQNDQIIESVKAVVAARPEADSNRIGVTGLFMGEGDTLSSEQMRSRAAIELAA